ncbi:MAG: secretin and TonB N-terminal domain-containing protein, partial [Sediminibacterium sp.]
MKLLPVLLLAAILQVSATGSAQQKISLSEKNAPLEKIFREIRKQSGFEFLYINEQLQAAPKVDVAVSNVTLDEALKAVLKNTALTYSIQDKTIVIRPKPVVAPATGNVVEPAAPIDVKGKVVDEKGLPVIATVTIKGTNKVVSTNDKGEFEFKGIDENAVLVVTAVNIETLEHRVAAKTEVSLVVRNKVSKMEDVVIEANTGYQKVKPNEVTGSITLINNKMLNEQTSPNILDRLKNVSNGVLFDTKQNNSRKKLNLTIRGVYSIDGPIDPLIVLDNFIYEGDLENINPNDIENITLLKDAAATSIWGARAGNGVIVITTKKAKF